MKLLVIFSFLIISTSIFSQNVGVNGDGSSPDASAILDVKSSDKGVLVPRVDIIDLSTAAPVTTPTTSLLVYNTNATTGPGFFYWDGAKWVSITGAKKVDDLSDGIVSGAGSTSYYIGLNSGATGTGAFNTSFGFESLKSVTSGKANTAFGGDVLTFLTTGEKNIGLGGSSGSLITTGSNNLMIGNATQPINGAKNRQLNIANIIYGDSIYLPEGRIGIGNGNNTPKSTFDIKGSVSLTINNGGGITLSEDHYTYLISSSGATVTLPTAVGIKGRVYIIKLTASGTATVNTTSSELIDGASTYSLTAQYKYIHVQSDGANWFIIAQN